MFVIDLIVSVNYDFSLLFFQIVIFIGVFYNRHYVSDKEKEWIEMKDIERKRNDMGWSKKNMSVSVTYELFSKLFSFFNGMV